MSGEVVATRQQNVICRNLQVRGRCPVRIRGQRMDGSHHTAQRVRFPSPEGTFQGSSVVERRAVNAMVEGSNPSLGAMEPTRSLCRGMLPEQRRQRTRWTRIALGGRGVKPAQSIGVGRGDPSTS